MGHLKMSTLVKSAHTRTERPLALSGPLGFTHVRWSPKASSEAPVGCQDNKAAKADRLLGFLPYFKQNSSEFIYLK